MPDDRKFIDPNSFTQADLPKIVLCDDRRSLMGWAIKDHTNGDYNHAFIMHKRGMCVSQDFGGFKEKPIGIYLKPNLMLKFWQIKDLTDTEKTAIQIAINARLALPWYRRAYDFLGTFVGQALNIKWIHSPFQVFCSVEVNDDYIKPIFRAKIIDLYQPSPSELNTAYVAHPENMECAGYWWAD